jgi:hypothetical protein
LSAVLPPRVSFSKVVIPQEVKFAMAGMGAMRSGVALRSREGALVTAQDEFLAAVMPVSEDSKRHPEVT